MEYVDWLFRVVIAGCAVWILRAYLVERTKRRKAGDQYLTVDEITKHCTKEHKTLKEGLTVEVIHVHELIKKDLEAGSKQFETHGTEIKGLAGEVKAVSRNMLKLTTALEKNGVKSWDGKPNRRQNDPQAHR